MMVNHINESDVLIIDDNIENLKVLQNILLKAGYRIRTAINGNLALQSANNKAPDLIILDIGMPEMDGYEVCQILKENEKLKNIPVIFISGHADTENKVKAFKAGGVDYITKPFQVEEVLVRVRTHLDLYKIRKNLDQLVLQRTEELKKNEERLDLAHDAANMGMFDWDIINDQAVCNERYFQLFGLKKQKRMLSVDDWLKMVHPDDRERARKEVQVALDNKVRYNTEYRIIWPDKTVKWLNSKAKVYFNNNGVPYRMIGAITDITTQKELEKELHTTQMHYTDYINYSFDAISYWKVPEGLKTDLPIETQIDMIMNSTCIDANRICWESFGLKSKEELINKKYIYLIKETNIDRFQTFIKNNYQQNNFRAYEIMPFGTKYYWLENMYGVVENKILKNIWVSAKDITELANAQESLKDSEKNYRTVADYTYDWEYWQLPNGTLKYVSPSCKRVTGYTPEDFIKNPDLINKIIYEPDQKHWKKHKQLIKKHPIYIEFRINTKKNVIRWIGHECQTIYDSDGKELGIRVSNRDITELKKTQEQLIQAQKMESLGHLAGGIAHDFNNILSAIIISAEMIRDDVSPESSIKEDIDQILKASTRAKHLVTQILSFSRQSKEIKSPIHLRSIIKEVADLLRASLPSTIEIRTNIIRDTKPVLANATKLHEVIMNLCTNAAYAMEDRGILEINYEEKQIESDLQGKTGIIKPGFYSIIRIKDTGCGIPDDALNNIFDPYFTTKPIGEGTGLGLAVVFGIIQSHNGNIILETEPGKGTEFQILIPKTDEKPKEIYANGLAIEGGNETIMFIDDEEIICRLINNLLKKLGYTVFDFSDSKKALQAFKENPEKYDIVITDQTMPVMTGLELSRELLQIRQNIPIILITGYSKKVDEEKVKKIGVKAFCMKPIHKDELASKIRALLDKKNI